MNVVQVQVEPCPIYEVQGFEGRKDFNALLAWLNSLDLPDRLSLSFAGNLYAFPTSMDRFYFALGFQQAWDIIDDEEEQGQKG